MHHKSSSQAPLISKAIALIDNKNGVNAAYSIFLGENLEI